MTHKSDRHKNVDSQRVISVHSQQGRLEVQTGSETGKRASFLMQTEQDCAEQQGKVRSQGPSSGSHSENPTGNLLFVCCVQTLHHKEPSKFRNSPCFQM